MLETLEVIDGVDVKPQGQGRYGESIVLELSPRGLSGCGVTPRKSGEQTRGARAKPQKIETTVVSGPEHCVVFSKCAYRLFDKSPGQARGIGADDERSGGEAEGPAEDTLHATPEVALALLPDLHGSWQRERPMGPSSGGGKNTRKHRGRGKSFEGIFQKRLSEIRRLLVPKGSGQTRLGLSWCGGFCENH